MSEAAEAAEAAEALAGWRREIDGVDEELTRLFEKRMELARQVAAGKKELSLPLLQPERENEVLNHVRGLLRDPALADGLTQWFRALMQVSKVWQAAAEPGLAPTAPPRQPSAPGSEVVGFQGVPGSFSEEALIACFGETAPRRAYAEFEDLFAALARGEISRGVLPIENSSTGAIGPVYDLLRQYDFVITAETSVRVRHHLLGLPGARLEDVSEVYSHPQGLEQCGDFLRRHPDWLQIPYHNTATGAKFVRDSGRKNRAAIAGGRAAGIYGLDILAPCINTRRDNYTRFIVIGPEPAAAPPPPEQSKISVLFTLAHRAGALREVLDCFARSGLNLLKIESRPERDNLWEYCFYVDFAGSPADPAVRETLAFLAANSPAYRFLGAYPREVCESDSRTRRPPR
ncbi:MAG: chorismate mutase [Gracilibacteraceae bacterium]|jgi:chorismate mutase/prephenate dehydratase|nr:chorismate mutase [Gracilibacteraceae bacterium]